MYGNYKSKNRPFKGRKKNMSPTKKAFLAGVEAGKRMARKPRFKRWY